MSVMNHFGRYSVRLAAFCLLSIGTTQLHAQEEHAHPVSVGMMAGSWSIGGGHWPYVLAGGEYRVAELVVLGLSAGGASRPVNLCSPGLHSPMCSERKVVRVLIASARLELGTAAVRPYLGVSAGESWYVHEGSLAGLQAGVVIPAGERFSLRGEGSLQALTDGDGGFASTLQAGVWFRL